MGNYVIEVGNYVIASPSELGNYMSADTAEGLDPRAVANQHSARTTSSRQVRRLLPAGVPRQRRSAASSRET